MGKLQYGIVIGILLVFAGYSFLRAEKLERAVAELDEAIQVNISSTEYLQENMPDYTDAFIKLNRGYLVLADRVDSLTAEVQGSYVPQEGSYEVSVSLDSTKLEEYNNLVLQYMAQLEELSPEQADSIQAEMLSLLYGIVQTEADIETSGFTVAPQIAVGVTPSGLDIGVGSRLYYTNRWGVGVEVCADLSDTENIDPGLGIYADVRDFIFGLRNLGFGIGVRKYLDSGDTRGFIGLRAYL